MILGVRVESSYGDERKMFLSWLRGLREKIGEGVKYVGDGLYGKSIEILREAKKEGMGDIWEGEEMDMAKGEGEGKGGREKEMGGREGDIQAEIQDRARDRVAEEVVEGRVQGKDGGDGKEGDNDEGGVVEHGGFDGVRFFCHLGGWSRKGLIDCFFPRMKEDFSNIIPLSWSEGGKKYFDALLEWGEVKADKLFGEDELAKKWKIHPAILWKAENVRKHRKPKPIP